MFFYVVSFESDFFCIFAAQKRNSHPQKKKHNHLILKTMAIPIRTNKPGKLLPNTAKPRRKTPLVIPVIPGYKETVQDPYHLSK